ncbi:hypothetical protein K438DRAFT_1779512 [Mycena galopus ATCC 62051]|nr:hypothetical protein K438DRAFT_1779512 [Mycena galopus ATCC 62051]
MNKVATVWSKAQLGCPLAVCKLFGSSVTACLPDAQVFHEEAKFQGFGHNFIKNVNRSGEALRGGASRHALVRLTNATSKNAYKIQKLLLTGITTNKQPREYLVGPDKDKYSIADIKPWSWIKSWAVQFTPEEVNYKGFSHMLAWVERIGARTAAKLGTGDKYKKNRKQSLAHSLRFTGKPNGLHSQILIYFPSSQIFEKEVERDENERPRNGRYVRNTLVFRF